MALGLVGTVRTVSGVRADIGRPRVFSPHPRLTQTRPHLCAPPRSQLVIGTPKERPWTNVLLVLLPITFCSNWLHWPEGLTFCLALAGLIPLAERLGFCTEALAEYTSDTLAGLINATMGNAPELLIAIFALKSSSLRIVQISLFGSIISNLLLVLGVSLTVGGLKHHEQSFSTVNSTNSITLLLVSIFCHLFASVIEEMHTGIYTTAVLQMSRAFAVLGILLYVALLFFQLRTHAELFADEESEDEEEHGAHGAHHPKHHHEELGDVSKDATTKVNVQPATGSGAKTVPKTPPVASPTAVLHGLIGSPAISSAVSTGADDTEVTTLAAHDDATKDDDDEPKMSFVESLVSLAVVAGVVSLMSEILTSSLKGAATEFKLSEGFVEAILTPIAGNAAEHWSAVYFAYRNRLNISFGIAVGSSVQIALFLIPFMFVLWTRQGRVVFIHARRRITPPATLPPSFPFVTARSSAGSRTSHSTTITACSNAPRFLSPSSPPDLCQLRGNLTGSTGRRSSLCIFASPSLTSSSRTNGGVSSQITCREL